jgi:hypothetical protein
MDKIKEMLGRADAAAAEAARLVKLHDGCDRAREEAILAARYSRAAAGAAREVFAKRGTPSDWEGSVRRLCRTALDCAAVVISTLPEFRHHTDAGDN